MEDNVIDFESIFKAQRDAKRQQPRSAPAVENLGKQMAPVNMPQSTQSSGYDPTPTQAPNATQTPQADYNERNITTNTGENAATHEATNGEITKIEEELNGVMKKISYIEGLLRQDEAARIGDPKTNQIAKYRKAAEIAAKYNMDDAKIWSQKADALEFPGATGSGASTNAAVKLMRLEQAQSDTKLNAQAQDKINEARGLIRSGSGRNSPEVNTLVSEAASLLSQMVLKTDKQRDLNLLKEEFGNVKQDFVETAEDAKKEKAVFGEVKQVYDKHIGFVKNLGSAFTKINAALKLYTRTKNPTAALAAYKGFIQSIDNSVVMGNEMGQGMSTSITNIISSLIQRFGFSKNGDYDAASGSKFTEVDMQNLADLTSASAAEINASLDGYTDIAKQLYKDRAEAQGLETSDAGLRSVATTIDMGRVPVEQIQITGGGAPAPTPTPTPIPTPTGGNVVPIPKPKPEPVDNSKLPVILD